MSAVEAVMRPVASLLQRLRTIPPEAIWSALGAVLGVCMAIVPGTVLMVCAVLVTAGIVVRMTPQRDRRFVLSLIGWGMGLRVAVWAVLKIVSVWRGDGGWLLGDSLGMHNYAWLLSQHVQGQPIQLQETMAGTVEELTWRYIPSPEKYGYNGMTYFVAAVYHQFGPMPWSIQLLNMLVGTLIGVGVWAIATPILGRLAGRAAGIAGIVWPTLMLWSLTLMKDAPYILAGVAFVWSLLKLHRTRRWRYAALAVASAVIQYAFRPSLLQGGVALCLGAATVMSWAPIRRRHVVLGLLIAAGMLIANRERLETRAQEFMRLTVDRHWGIVVSTRGWNYQIFPAKYYDRARLYDAIPYQDFAVGVARGIQYVLFAPFPNTLLGGGLSRLAAFPQTICWYLALFFAPWGIARAWRRQRMATALVLGFVVPATVFIAMFSGNIGTLLRHRDIVSPFFLMFSMAGVAAWAVTKPARKPSVLYVTYNGVLEPIVQAQALPYLRRLASSGYRIVLLSFEKPHDLRCAGPEGLKQRRRALAGEGLTWRWLRYHKVPSVPATAYDIIRGIVAGWRLAIRHGCSIVHARGTVAAAMGHWVAAPLGRKFLFDLRGLMAEEYADGGLWARNSWRFRQVSRVERRLLAGSDAVIVLTERIREVLSRNGHGDRSLPPMTVIPCCVDLERFQPRARDADLARRLGVADGLTVMYVGSLGTWYLLEPMLDWFAQCRRIRPDAQFLIVTQTDPARVRAAAAARMLDRTVIVAAAPPEQMPRYWSLADAAVSFIRPTYSKSASSPTKIGEALASGVPVIVNRGVGDLDALVERYRCGVLAEMTEAGYAASAQAMLALCAEPDVRLRCRRAAEEALALSDGAERYARIYRALGAP